MSHDTLDYAARIRRLGYRLTPQREMILDALCEIGHHATVGELYERVQEKAPAIDRATIYRAMKFFCDLQLVVCAGIDGATVYEIAGHIPHHHLVCRSCGHVQEFDDYHFHDLLRHLKEAYGFQAIIEHLTIPGLCRECLETSEVA